MTEIRPVIKQIRSQIQALDNKEGARLNDICELVKNLTDFTSDFENLWVGGWGQEDFNYYRDFNNNDQVIEATIDYFSQLIERRYKINLEKISKEIFELLKPYKKCQSHLLTELSPINDLEKFKNEIELLKSIEKFKWGYEPSDYADLRMPSQIPVYDMSQLAKGIRTPPHISVIGYVMSLTTKSFSVKHFSDLVTRTLRQVEIKLNITPESNESDFTEDFLNSVFENFHGFYRQLVNRHANRTSIDIKDEYDVQDLIHAILKLKFKDIREEEYTPSYAGSATRVDFLLKNENIVIEIKKTRDRLADKEVGEQLILDVAHYKNHPNCKRLKCFVYDPENRIRNPRGLEGDLKRLSDENMSVELYIRP